MPCADFMPRNNGFVAPKNEERVVGSGNGEQGLTDSKINDLIVKLLAGVQLPPLFQNDNMKTTIKTEIIENHSADNLTHQEQTRIFCDPRQTTFISNGDLQNCADFYAKENESQHHTDFGDLIFEYTRAQAITDGLLVDVSKLAAEAGFKFPVAMTDAAWHESVAVPETLKFQDETGRLWDVLMMLRFALRSTAGQGSEIQFRVVVQKADNSLADIRLKALCHPGDGAEPVITILLPDEWQASFCLK